jgi:GNAT superfamily N-acetyltransferase
MPSAASVSATQFRRKMQQESQLCETDSPAKLLLFPQCNIILILVGEINGKRRIIYMNQYLDRYHIRKIWPLDYSAFHRHLLRLDYETRLARFGTAVNDSFLSSYAESARRIGTVIYGAFIGSEMYASAELRSIHMLGDAMAEAAFTVEKDHRLHGLGSALMDRVITTAQNRGIGQVHMICMRANMPMQRLAEKFGARMKIDHGEAMGEVDSASATPISWLDEAMHDAADFVTAVLDWRPGIAA